MWVICNLHKWGDQELKDDRHPNVKFRMQLPEDGSVGYLPVFRDMASAIREYPDSQVVEIQLVVREKDDSNSASADDAPKPSTDSKRRGR